MCLVEVGEDGQRPNQQHGIRDPTQPLKPTCSFHSCCVDSSQGSSCFAGLVKSDFQDHATGSAETRVAGPRYASCPFSVGQLPRKIITQKHNMLTIMFGCARDDDECRKKKPNHGSLHSILNQVPKPWCPRLRDLTLTIAGSRGGSVR